MMHADFYTEAWLMYLLTSAIFLVLLFLMLRLFFKSFWIVGVTMTLFSVGLLTPMNNSVGQVDAIAPAIMVMGLSGMDNLFASSPDWSLTIKSFFYLLGFIALAQTLLIISRMAWLKFKAQS